MLRRLGWRTSPLLQDPSAWRQASAASHPQVRCVTITCHRVHYPTARKCACYMGAKVQRACVHICAPTACAGYDDRPPPQQHPQQPPPMLAAYTPEPRPYADDPYGPSPAAAPRPHPAPEPARGAGPAARWRHELVYGIPYWIVSLADACFYILAPCCNAHLHVLAGPSIHESCAWLVQVHLSMAGPSMTVGTQQTSRRLTRQPSSSSSIRPRIMRRRRLPTSTTAWARRCRLRRQQPLQCFTCC